LLRRLVGSLCLGADLSYPAVLGRRSLVENQYLIVSHSLLGDNDLLTSIDDEVASLIVDAVLTILDSLLRV